MEAVNCLLKPYHLVHATWPQTSPYSICNSLCSCYVACSHVPLAGVVSARKGVSKYWKRSVLIESARQSPLTCRSRPFSQLWPEQPWSSLPGSHSVVQQKLLSVNRSGRINILLRSCLRRCAAGSHRKQPCPCRNALCSGSSKQCGGQAAVLTPPKHDPQSKRPA